MEIQHLLPLQCSTSQFTVKQQQLRNVVLDVGSCESLECVKAICTPAWEWQTAPLTMKTRIFKELIKECKC